MDVKKSIKKVRNVLLMFIILFLFFGMYVYIQAAPSISSISQTNIRNGDSITISGSDFGIKTQVAPLIWDNVETGEFHSDWVNTSDLLISDNNQRHLSSRYNGYVDMYDYEHAQGSFQAQNDVYPKWFVQYWVYFDVNFDFGTTGYTGDDRFLSNMKIFRLWNFTDINENFCTAYGGPGDRIECNVENTGDTDSYHAIYGFQNIAPKGSWNLLQFEYKENSDLNEEDGVFRFWVNGTLTIEDLSIITREDYSQYKRPLLIGFHAVWGPNTSLGEGTDAPNEYHIDDIYMDNSWARIEIGDNENYNNCTHREIQIPSAWSDNSIIIAVNQGSFSEQDTIYLFVVDEAGDVSEGYPISFVAESPVGDINDDGKVNIQDIQLCVNVILEIQTNPEIVQRAKEAAEPLDECNELDLQGIINIILSK